MLESVKCKTIRNDWGPVNGLFVILLSEIFHLPGIYLMISPERVTILKFGYIIWKSKMKFSHILLS